MSDFFGYSAMPGPGTATTTNERNALLGPITWYLLKGIIINSTAASDAGNTPTTELRHGLLMGQRTSDSFYAHYQPNATDGTQVAHGFLWEARRTIDTDGNTVNRPAQLVIAGYVQASQLLLLDSQARAQMYGRFLFDDSLPGNPQGLLQSLAKTADYTVTTADNCTLFTNTGAAGAVNFTLPVTPAKGLRYVFFVTANQSVTVTAAAGKLVAFNNAAATSVALSTAGNKIGSGFEIVADETGAKWLAMPIGAGTVTVA